MTTVFGNNLPRKVHFPLKLFNISNCNENLKKKRWPSRRKKTLSSLWMPQIVLLFSWFPRNLTPSDPAQISPDHQLAWSSNHREEIFWCKHVGSAEPALPSSKHPSAIPSNLLKCNQQEWDEHDYKIRPSLLSLTSFEDLETSGSLRHSNMPNTDSQLAPSLSTLFPLSHKMHGSV